MTRKKHQNTKQIKLIVFILEHANLESKNHVIKHKLIFAIKGSASLKLCMFFNETTVKKLTF